MSVASCSQAAGRLRVGPQTESLPLSWGEGHEYER
jgi:hypothetical protein